jgi:hypothetical protein
MNVSDESRSAIAGYVGRFACVLTGLQVEESDCAILELRADNAFGL